jgi:hypothetical protein
VRPVYELSGDSISGITDPHAQWSEAVGARDVERLPARRAPAIIAPRA